MEKSTHKAEVVPVVLEKHPNADSLSIVKVFGYQVACRTEDWQSITQGCYLPPDSLVDTTRPEFKFLERDAKYASDSTTPGPYARIKAKKLRGYISYGLLVPAQDGTIGDDWAERLGVRHYEPPIKGESGHRNGLPSGEAASGPNTYAPKYDVDSFQRYAGEIFVEGEDVFCSEKIHGCSARYVYLDGEFHCGSRTEWKREYPSTGHLNKETLLAQGFAPEKIDYILDRAFRLAKKQNLWWKVFRQTPSLQKFLQDNPGLIVYGEVYGCNVQDMAYGTKDGESRFAAFDILHGTEWLNYDEARELGKDLPWVPDFGVRKYNFEELVELATGDSLFLGANHIREGCVVKPVKERIHPAVGRCQLKIVSWKYLER